MMSAESIFWLIFVALLSGLAGVSFGVIWMGAAEVGWKRASKAFFNECAIWRSQRERYKAVYRIIADPGEESQR